MTTATATAAPSLSARVLVLGYVGRTKVNVQVISGIGGWNRPGKRLTVDASILSDVIVADN